VDRRSPDPGGARRLDEPRARPDPRPCRTLVPARHPQPELPAGKRPGGGGVASLRIDPQGKAFAQQLLEIQIPVPQRIADKVN
jgi:hypothetical protein